MGEVYRARDTKLNRDVAIKVLLPAVANDPDRLARFSREAQVLASLNHPNIAHIHGSGHAEENAVFIDVGVEQEGHRSTVGACRVRRRTLRPEPRSGDAARNSARLPLRRVLRSHSPVGGRHLEGKDKKSTVR